MEQQVPKLGELISGLAYRDAIHVAVAPVVAGMTLDPGQHVTVNPADMTAWASPLVKSPTVGVVDPFLRGPVYKGQTFWLCLYPNTITSLRHSWTHPMFKARVPDRVAELIRKGAGE